MKQNIIGICILNMRKAKGLSQKELAEKLNYSDKVISKWERGESLPDIIAIESISKFFGITIDELVLGVRGNDSTRIADIQTAIPLTHSKKPSKILIWSIVPITLLWLSTIFAGIVMFLSVTFIYSLFLVAYGFMISYNDWETKYDGHEISIVNKPTKAFLMIDGVIVDQDISLLKMGIKLQSSLGNKSVSVYISSLFILKCEIVII
jgi:transcriptional regulator with XRE-family HTH domain